MSIEIDIAERWRKDHGYQGRGGMVIIFDDVPSGWVEVLPPASHWCPGVIAVDEEGHMWKAVGGSEQDGVLCGLLLTMQRGKPDRQGEFPILNWSTSPYR